MDSMKVHFVVVFHVVATLFFVLMSAGSSGRQRAEGMASAARDFPVTDYEAMVEKFWSKCDRHEITKSSFDVNQKPRLLTKDNIQPAISLLPPQSKHALLDSLGQQNSAVHVIGEDYGRRSWNKEFRDPCLGWHAASRRHLADHSLQIVSFASSPAPSLASAPALASAPGPALASTPEPAPASGPGPAFASTPAPTPGIETPGFGPIPSPSPGPANTPISDAPTADYSELDFPPESSDSVADTAPEAAIILPKKHSNNTRSIIMVVVLTGAGSFLLAGIFFCCYSKCKRSSNNSKNGQRDDRSLLTLSLSDFSGGSSQKSYGLGNSINKEKFGTLSFKPDPVQIGRVSSLDTISGETPPSGVPRGISSSSIAPPALDDKPAVVPKPPPGPPPPPPPLMPPPGKKVASPVLGPPPPPPPPKSGPRPPPPPKGAFPTRPPQASSSSGRGPSPLGSNRSGNIAPGQQAGADIDNNASKAKLKPFFWDKVSANPDQSMVWHQISSGSFQFNEEMIKTLFGYNSTDKRKTEVKKESSSNDASTQHAQLLDPKKSQNLAILLRALNVTTEEVSDALMEGNELPNELLQTLLKMAPTAEEELKLRLYSGDIPLLGTAERFLKSLVDIPFAFKRLDALLFMGSLQEDISSMKESFTTLEIACKELRSSRLFLKLLEAVLKTGNRMNDGTYRGGAQAFKLDTLLKLADVKGTDGKTTLLHFVVQEIIRSEGMRAARMARESGSILSLNSDDFMDDSPRESVDHFRSLGLKVVSGLGYELENVKKAATLDVDALTSTVANLGHELVKTKEFMNKDMRSMDEDSGFHHSLKCFVEHAELGITSLLEEEKRTRTLVKNTTDYFDGNAAKDEGLRLFVIVRDFLGMVDKACKEVSQAPKRVQKMPVNKEAPTMQPVPDPRHLLFPAIRDRRVDYSSSDDDSS